MVAACKTDLDRQAITNYQGSKSFSRPIAAYCFLYYLLIYIYHGLAANDTKLL